MDCVDLRVDRTATVEHSRQYECARKYENRSEDPRKFVLGLARSGWSDSTRVEVYGSGVGSFETVNWVISWMRSTATLSLVLSTTSDEFTNSLGGVRKR
jgi:hypothetical protein